MNNGVNQTNNNVPNQVVEQPILQPLTNPPVVPSTVSVIQPVVPVVQPVLTPVPAQVVPETQPDTMPVESNEQTIPGVIVANPVNGGMDKPNPIQPLPGTEVATEPVTEAPVLETTPVVVPEDNGKKKKKKNKLARFWFFIVVCLIGVIVYLEYTHKMTVDRLNYECTPVSTTGDVKELDLESTIVKDLYSKVYTNLKEDLASVEMNDQMKVYLAFRQVPESKFYDSNCNLFSATSMEPFACVESSVISPLAFKEEDLKLELKKLFGDRAEIPLMNVHLGEKSCIGGYQYIPERGEFVEGKCTTNAATMYKFEKKLVKAESKEAFIMLYEEVKYYNAEGVDLPEKLKSGTYIYTFKLDMNYNYIYESKVLQEK